VSESGDGNKGVSESSCGEVLLTPDESLTKSIVPSAGRSRTGAERASGNGGGGNSSNGGGGEVGGISA
jgi:hypothetical protein